MLKKTVDRYQHGSVRKVNGHRDSPRSFATTSWKGRYGNRKYRPSTRRSTRPRKLSGNTWRASSLAQRENRIRPLSRRYVCRSTRPIHRRGDASAKIHQGWILSIINKLRPQWGSMLLPEGLVRFIPRAARTGPRTSHQRAY